MFSLAAGFDQHSSMMPVSEGFVAMEYCGREEERGELTDSLRSYFAFSVHVTVVMSAK